MEIDWKTLAEREYPGVLDEIADLPETSEPEPEPAPIDPIKLAARAEFERAATLKARELAVLRRAQEILADVDARNAAAADVPVAERLRLIDFSTLGEETEPPVFTIPYLVPEGAYVALYSAAGLGKSLLVQEAAVAVATGGEFLGKTCKQRHVLYIDLENPRAAIRDRMESLGVPLTDDLTAWLHYSHLADWAVLNTEAGGAMLLEAVDELGAELVVLDTTMRAVMGPENASDTFNDLYRHVALGLKARSCAFLRLDHTGKDPERGQRGSSAKEGAEDLTFLLEQGTGEDRLTLHRKKNRLALDGSGMLPLQRMSDPLRHMVIGGDRLREDKIAMAIWILDDAAAPAEIGRPAARKILAAAEPPWKGRNDVLDEALIRRRWVAGLVAE